MGIEGADADNPTTRRVHFGLPSATPPPPLPPPATQCEAGQGAEAQERSEHIAVLRGS